MSVLVVMGAAGAAWGPPRILVNGEEIFSDPPPQIVNDRVLVPLKVVADALGVGVDWDGANRTVLVWNAGTPWETMLNEPKGDGALDPFDYRLLGPTAALREYLAALQLASFDQDRVLVRYELLDAYSLDLNDPAALAAEGLKDQGTAGFLIQARLYWGEFPKDNRLDPGETKIVREELEDTVKVSQVALEPELIEVEQVNYQIVPNGYTRRVNRTDGTEEVIQGSGGWEVVAGKSEVVFEETPYEPAVTGEKPPLLDFSSRRVLDNIAD